MRQKLCTVLIFAVMLSLFAAACSPHKAEQALDAVEDAVEQRLDPVEDAVDRQLDTIEDAIEGQVRITPAPVPKADVPKTEPAPAPAVKTTEESLTGEQAQTIALEHANLRAEEVSHLRTRFDMDDGVPEYDVQFHHGRWEYEYEIHAQTGKILSFEKDD